MTANEKALIEAAVKWEKWLTHIKKGCRCRDCVLMHAVRRVVKERKGGKEA
jgi:hypothetical protein